MYSLKIHNYVCFPHVSASPPHLQCYLYLHKNNSLRMLVVTNFKVSCSNVADGVRDGLVHNEYVCLACGRSRVRATAGSHQRPS